MKFPVKPDFDQLQELTSSSDANVIPVYLEMPADLLTPVSAYLKLSHGHRYSFLFESVEGGAKIGRYSFLGAGPNEVIEAGEGNQITGDPVAYAEERLKGLKVLDNPNLPSFTGGLVSYISYDCIQHFEPATKQKNLKDNLGIPDALFQIYDVVVVFDHLHHLIKIVGNFRKDAKLDPKRQYDELCDKLMSLCELLNDPQVPLPEQPSIDVANSAEYKSNVGQQGYENFVKFLKSHIKDGDIIQAVPSQRISRLTKLHPFNAYRQLRSLNPSPYMFYLDCQDFQVVGASPEMLCKVERGTVYTHPIAGTRKRGKTPEEDAALEKDLLSDIKERSEHIMLVDLGRNDVNRVCDPQTVKVDSLMHIERYSHVMHIVSHVSGKLRHECTPFDAFRSIFPAGTVSGAPKIRAIQLVYECEKEKRGIYAGAVGYFALNGDIDTAIAIRTMLFKDGVAYLQAGGGIVYDSEPTFEYEETMNKLGSSLAALKRSEAQFAK